MEINKNTKILIVGLGVIGGSYARALTKKGYEIKAIDISQKTIDYALENKIIAYGTTEVDPALVGEADIIVFALYPHTFKKWITDGGPESSGKEGVHIQRKGFYRVLGIRIQW